MLTTSMCTVRYCLCCNSLSVWIFCKFFVTPAFVCLSAVKCTYY